VPTSSSSATTTNAAASVTSNTAADASPHAADPTSIARPNTSSSSTASSASALPHLGETIQVHVRIRPSIDGHQDQTKQTPDCLWPENERTLTIARIGENGSNNASSSSMANSISNSVASDRERSFTFDRVWGPDTTQEQLFEEIAPKYIESALQGYNGTILAYGQTGSGKTYSMLGPPSSLSSPSSPSRGLIPRLLDRLFVAMRARENEVAAKIERGELPEKERVVYKAEVEFMEIYNEVLRDLLAPQQSTTSNLDIRSFPNVHVPGLSRELLTSSSDAMRLLEIGNRNRTFASTRMNAHSSRSHSVFTIHVQANYPGASRTTSARLNLVDLAGSENQKAAGTSGERLKEGANINKSLSALASVILALSKRSQLQATSQPTSAMINHIPYRSSRLTFLLSDSLGGNSRTVLLATVPTSASLYADSISTLQFAATANNVRAEPTQNLAVHGQRMDALAMQKKIERIEKALQEERLKNAQHATSMEEMESSVERMEELVCWALDTATSACERESHAEQKMSSNMEETASLVEQIEQELNAQMEEHERMHVELSKAQTSLEERRMALEEQSKSIVEYEQRIESLMKSLSDREEELNTTKQQVAERDAQLQALQTTLSSKGDTVANLQEQLMRAQSEVSQLRKDVSERDERISNLDSQVNERSEQVEGLRKELGERNEALQQMRKEAAEASNMWNEKEVQWTQEKHATQARQQSMEEEHLKQLQQLQQQVDSLTAELKTQHERLESESMTTRQSHCDELSALNDRIDSLESELTKAQESTSETISRCEMLEQQLKEQEETAFQAEEEWKALEEELQKTTEGLRAQLNAAQAELNQRVEAHSSESIQLQQQMDSMNEEHARMVEELSSKHHADVESLRSEHAAELGQLRSDHTRELAEMGRAWTSMHQQQVQEELLSRLDESTAHHASELSQLHTKLTKLRAANKRAKKDAMEFRKLALALQERIMKDQEAMVRWRMKSRQMDEVEAQQWKEVVETRLAEHSQTAELDMNDGNTINESSIISIVFPTLDALLSNSATTPISADHSTPTGAMNRLKQRHDHEHEYTQSLSRSASKSNASGPAAGAIAAGNGVTLTPIHALHLRTSQPQAQAARADAHLHATPLSLSKRSDVNCNAARHGYAYASPSLARSPIKHFHSPLPIPLPPPPEIDPSVLAAVDASMEANGDDADENGWSLQLDPIARRLSEQDADGIDDDDGDDDDEDDDDDIMFNQNALDAAGDADTIALSAHLATMPRHAMPVTPSRMFR